MKVPIQWLEQEFIKPASTVNSYTDDLSYKTIGIKELTPEYFELDMKGYNRADLLSMRGVAYEISALENTPVLFTETEEPEFIWNIDHTPQSVKVNISAPELSPFYAVAKIEGLQIANSSPDLIKKLAEAGMRSVNNVADITNLVMLEYGQPLHAFDAETINNETLVVRTAQNQESVVTLNNKEQHLQDNDLVIADSEKIVGIAGVMGGKNSEITQNTTIVLLEAAIFDPVSLRRTSKRLGLESEASKRFYHGLTKKRLLQALDRAIRMYLDLGGKLTGITIEDRTQEQSKTITLSLSRVNSLIGITINRDDIEESLKNLNFKINIAGEDQWEITPPYWRLDIEREEDIIEEIARMYDYRNIVGNGKNVTEYDKAEINQLLPQKVDPTIDFDYLYLMKKSLVDLGFTEVQTYPYYSSNTLENLSLNKDQLVKIANPISSETEYLRQSLWPNLLTVVIQNLKSRDQIAIFEIGKIYQSQDKGVPVEGYRVSIALSHNSDKTITELWNLFKKFSAKVNLDINLGTAEAGEDEIKYFHPVRFSNLTKEQKNVGILAEIHPRITNKFKVNNRVAILEFQF